jgi:protein ImuB
MFRYLVAHVPSFRLDRCGWSPSQPVILVAEQHNALRVQAATPVALAAGIRVGMSVAAARALVPHVETELLDADAEAADLHALTTQLLPVSPSIAAMPPDTVVAEITRQPEVRAGQERALVERVRIRMNQLGHSANIVVADDPTTAHHVARWCTSNTIIPPGQGAQALASLPLTALSIPTRDLTRLDNLGITTIGRFAQLPPAALSGRFSPPTLTAHALACGRAPTPTITPWSEEGPLSLTQELPDEVVELEALLFVINALIRDLTTRLLARGLATTQLELTFRLDGGRQQSIALRLGAPTRHPTAILDQIRHRLERFQLGGPVVALILTLPNPSPFDGRQIDLRDPQRTDEAIDTVSAQLQDALGNRSVLTARSIPRHRPEGAWRPVPFGTTVPRDGSASATALAASHEADPVDAWMGNPMPLMPERPPIMISPPQAVEVEAGPMTEGFPVSAVHVDGRWHAITHSQGPEQVAGEWWSQPFQRTYWQATLDDGRAIWLYREHGRWAVHGWWDR